MKQITNKEYEEWQRYKEEKAKGHVLMPDTLRFICAANDYDPMKIGQHFLEVLSKVFSGCYSSKRYKMTGRSWMTNRTLKLYGKQGIIKCSMTLWIRR